VAPPDAVAATALRPPHRLLAVLEGESLLNDASALCKPRSDFHRLEEWIDWLEMAGGND
jgi:hypothetical protein